MGTRPENGLVVDAELPRRYGELFGGVAQPVPLLVTGERRGPIRHQRDVTAARDDDVFVTSAS